MRINILRPVTYQGVAIAACALLAITATDSYSQPDTLWTSGFREVVSNLGGTVIRTNDTGFVAVGRTQLEGRRDSDVGLVKTNSVGRPIWNRRYEGFPDSVNRADEANAVIQMPDSGYLMVGSASPRGMVIRTELDGNLRWLRYFYEVTELTSCVRTEDNNILVCSYRNLWKLNDLEGGEPIWRQRFENGRGLNIVANSSWDSFLIYGNTTAMGAGSSDMYAAKIDSEGEIIWERAYGTRDGEFGLGATATSDGGWCLVGSSQRGEVGDIEERSMIVRIDSEGNLIWQRIYEDGQRRHYLLSVVETPDGGIAAAGEGGTGQNVYKHYSQLRVDYFGEELWRSYYLGDRCFSLFLMEDGGYTLGGWNGQLPLDDEVGGTWLVRTESDPVDLPFQLRARPDSHDFDEVHLDSVAIWNIPLYNYGRRYVWIDSLAYAGDTAAFAFDLGGFGDFPIRINPADTLYIPVGFRPTTDTTYSAVLIFFYGDSQSVEVALTGRGFAPNEVPHDGLKIRPTEFGIVSAYPNPFNSSTRISFALPYRSDVRLSVYDLSGREVATLITGELYSGSHSVQWSAGGFASGVYLIRLATPDFTKVEKMALIR